MLGLSSTKGIYAMCILRAQCVWNVCATVWQMLWSVLRILFNYQLWQSRRSSFMSNMSPWRIKTTKKPSGSNSSCAAVNNMERTRRAWAVQATYNIREKEHEWILKNTYPCFCIGLNHQYSMFKQREENGGHVVIAKQDYNELSLRLTHSGVALTVHLGF